VVEDLMRPRERRETGEQDLFRSRLDQIIDVEHALLKLARTIDWGFLETKFGAVYKDGAGQPPLSTRLMAELAILKHAYNLSDEVVLVDREPVLSITSAGRSFPDRAGAVASTCSRNPRPPSPAPRSIVASWRNRRRDARSPRFSSA
jgi:hypothetical protein